VALNEGLLWLVILVIALISSVALWIFNLLHHS
jgi:hypothetical protein